MLPRSVHIVHSSKYFVHVAQRTCATCAGDGSGGARGAGRRGGRGLGSTGRRCASPCSPLRINCQEQADESRAPPTRHLHPPHRARESAAHGGREGRPPGPCQVSPAQVRPRQNNTQAWRPACPCLTARRDDVIQQHAPLLGRQFPAGRQPCDEERRVACLVVSRHCTRPPRRTRPARPRPPPLEKLFQLGLLKLEKPEYWLRAACLPVCVCRGG